MGFMFTASSHYSVKLFQLSRMSQMMISSVSSRKHWILQQPKQSGSPVTVERYYYDRVSSTVSNSWTSIRQGKVSCRARQWWNVSSAQQDRYFAAVGANCFTTWVTWFFS